MAMPTKIMVIRHAEKPDDKHQGVTSHGDADKESLIVRGWQRAGALTALFDPTNGPLQNPNLAVPKVIYASDPEKPSEADDDDGKKGSKSKRPLQTITPLAERLGIKDKVNVKFAKGDEKHMVESVLGESGVVLISWQHQNIADIAKHIVGSKPPTKPIPARWPGDRFDIVWVFTPPAPSSDHWGFVQVPQQLLSGDAGTVIA
jgi:broad specificity phosphatase PhoE